MPRKLKRGERGAKRRDCGDGVSGTGVPPATPAVITRAIIGWFRASARDLPWRRRRSGYAALVSEAMLQQTQVSRVVESFERFMRAFPTVERLADADEQQVLSLWQGLGYYRRAKNLHAAARMIRDEFGGVVPHEVAELRRLPGVGRYTAGAIASIVHGRAEPIVDGNVSRVLARLHGWRDESTSQEAVRRTWDAAAALVREADHPGAFNEGMMELGATVCTPAAPACGSCPAATWCEARRLGIQREIPPAKAPARQRPWHHHVVVVKRGDMILLEQRPEHGMWAGMWQAPTVEAARLLHATEIVKSLRPRVSRISWLASFPHQTTHRRITFHVFAATTRVRAGQWREANNLADLPMSNPQRLILSQWGNAGV